MLPKVPLATRSIDDFADAAGPEAVDRIRDAARPLRGVRVLHINSTAFGGGVAELLTSQLPVMRAVGLDAEWAVLQGSEEFFGVTKAVHNALHGAEIAWTERMRRIYWERIGENARLLNERYDFVFVHDPQPAGILEVLEADGRRHGRWLWRCHVDMSVPFEPVWRFIEPIVDRFDAAIFTIEDFAQPGVRHPVRAIIPPSIDPLSAKNRPLDMAIADGIVANYGIDPDRPLVAQVSRFDPWKDPLGVIDAYRLVRHQIDGLQLLMVGSLADDDPEGRHYLEMTAAHADGDPDIHLLTNVQGVGDLEVNAFQREADVIIQKSKREGFGLVVAEAMWKRKPVVGGAVGGIRLQVEDGVSGFLVESAEECAKRVEEIFHDQELRERLGAAARERVRERFLTLREVEDLLRLMAEIS